MRLGPSPALIGVFTIDGIDVAVPAALKIGDLDFRRGQFAVEDFHQGIEVMGLMGDLTAASLLLRFTVGLT